MNAHKTKFGFLFMDLLSGLEASFPDCKETTKTAEWLKRDPTQLNTIKLDWARTIKTYPIASFPKVLRYFEAIQKNVAPAHIFNRLKLCDKYKSMKDDKDAQEALCSLLADMEEFCLDDAIIDPPAIIEEPTTPVSDQKVNQAPTKLRFDDPELHQLCIEKTGDEKLVNDMRALCLGIPELNEMYYNASNEDIAQQMVIMKPMCPMLMQMFQMGLPLGPIIQMVTQVTKQWEAENRTTSASS